MTRRTAAITLTFLCVVWALTGCSQNETQVTHDEGGNVKWEQAKAIAQATTLQIVALIPSDDVVGVDQNATGTLFSCSETQHRWHGTTVVTMPPGTNIESIAKSVEVQLSDLLQDQGDFAVTHDRDFFDDYMVVAESTATAESYLLGEWEANSIIIDAWSECFTLPEGTYPGGDF